MSYYVAFPAHLLDELLALLPADERPVYAERFERIVGDLVWLRADAENAMETALTESDHAGVFALREDNMARQSLVDALMACDSDALTGLVQNGLTTMADDLIQAALSALSAANV